MPGKERKVVVITGAGRGIGREIALYLAARGVFVMVNDLGCDLEGRGSSPSVAESVAKEIRDVGGAAYASDLDVRDPASPKRLFEQTIECFGRIDSLICSAGISRESALLSMSDEDLEIVLSTQLLGSIRMTQAVSRIFLEQESGGSVVLMTSPQAFASVPRRIPDTIASAGVTSFVRSAALELHRHGIRVNAIAPMARTRLTEHSPSLHGLGQGSLGPEYVAPLAAFLISDLSREIGGEVIGVAGGRIYALQNKETPGVFVEGGPAQIEEILRLWPKVTAISLIPSRMNSDR